MSTSATPVPDAAAMTPPSPRLIDAGSYAVHVGSGLRHDIAHFVSESAPAHHYAIVTDENVAHHYASAVGDSLAAESGVATSLHIIPAGEHQKTREQWSSITDELLALGAGRDTTVVALGGGVIGDLAGFVAATYLRGVPVVQCPTSLLAMIDASVGGKTGVDTAAGKNLVGAFHPPSVVIADVDVISTLPPEHRRTGLAEAIKHGVIADAGYFAWIGEQTDALLSADAHALAALVMTSVAIKANVVRLDERESGRRKTLNFGHTIGHAIEHASRYAFSHGECVAIGMVIEATIAERLGLCSTSLSGEIESVLRRAELPVSLPASLDAAGVLAATRGDKKSRGGKVEYALPSHIGAMAGEESGWAIQVPDALVLEALR